MSSREKKGSARAPRALFGALAEELIRAGEAAIFRCRAVRNHRRVFGEGAEDSPRGRLAHPPSSAMPFLLLGGRSPSLLRVRAHVLTNVGLN
jgi:hypothetical protein